MAILGWLRGLSAGAWKMIAAFGAAFLLLATVRQAGRREGESAAREAGQQRAFDVARARSEVNGHPLNEDETRRLLTRPGDRS